jgi:Ca2+/H+ antiporter
MVWELPIIICIIGTCFLFVYLANSFEETHIALKLLLIGVTFFVILIALNLNFSILEANNSTLVDTTNDNIASQLGRAYGSVLWTIVAVIVYVIIYLLYYVATISIPNRKK